MESTRVEMLSTSECRDDQEPKSWKDGLLGRSPKLVLTGVHIIPHVDKLKNKPNYIFSSKHAMEKIKAIKASAISKEDAAERRPKQKAELISRLEPSSPDNVPVQASNLRTNLSRTRGTTNTKATRTPLPSSPIVPARFRYRSHKWHLWRSRKSSLRSGGIEIDIREPTSADRSLKYRSRRLSALRWSQAYTS